MDIDTEIDRIGIYPVEYLILDLNCIENIKGFLLQSEIQVAEQQRKDHSHRFDKFAGSEVVSCLFQWVSTISSGKGSAVQNDSFTA